MFEKQSVYFDPSSNVSSQFFSDLQGWQTPEEEGQLSVDVLQTADQIIVVAAIAGALPEDLSLHLHDDLLTIRGERRFPFAEKSELFYQECFWGKFSRTIVLPVSVKEESAQAEYRNGVLIIRLNKSRSDNSIPILIVEE
jgi:HSP20 family protein